MNGIDLQGVNGSILVTRIESKDGSFDFSFFWRGGDTISISNVFLNDSDAEIIRRDGDDVQIGPYKARITKRFSEYVIAERVRE